MLTFITILHILVIILLVTCVLLQDSKGDGALGMGGGGSSQSLFGATGASNFLVTATRWLGAVFAFTCIALTYYSSGGQAPSTMDDYQAPAAAAPVIPGAATPDAAAKPADATAAPAKEAPATTEKKTEKK